MAGVDVAGFDSEGAGGEGVVASEILPSGEVEAEPVTGIAGVGWGARWDRL